jgi:uncharacterized protein (DUF362 family)
LGLRLFPGLQAAESKNDSALQQRSSAKPRQKAVENQGTMQRRDFIKTGTVGGAALWASACGDKPLWRPQAYRRREQSRVAIIQASNYEIDLTGLILKSLEAFSLEIRGKRILLKPNLVEYEKDNVINTHPAVIGAAIRAFRRLGARQVVVAEGPGHRRDTDGLLRDSGLLPHLEQTATEFVDLNLDDTRRLPLLSRFMGIDSLCFAASALDVDLLVSMPKLKTHHWAGMTLSMKNLFGIVPGVKYGWPKNFLHWHGIHQSIVDINSTVPPHFAIVDGIVAMEGNGPIQGKPKPCGVLVCGDDPVAVDSTCARLAGINPAKIQYLKTASDFLGNLEESKISQVGEPISALQQDFEVIESFQHLKT